MKKIYLLLVLQLAAFALFAQKPPHLPLKGPDFFDPIKEQKTINGYTVRLIPAMGGGFGFDILRNNHPVVHQFQNPLPYLPKGVQNKDDAFKIAQWMITQHQVKGQWEPLVPPQAVRTLKIKTN